MVVIFIEGAFMLKWNKTIVFKIRIRMINDFISAKNQANKIALAQM